MDSEICQNSVILDKILNEITLEGKICNTVKDFCGKNLTSYFIVQKEMPTPHKNKAKISPFNIYSVH